MNKIANLLKKTTTLLGSPRISLIIATILLGIVNFSYLITTSSVDDLAQKFPEWLIILDIINVCLILGYLAIKARRLLWVKKRIYLFSNFKQKSSYFLVQFVYYQFL